MSFNVLSKNKQTINLIKSNIKMLSSMDRAIDVSLYAH